MVRARARANEVFRDGIAPPEDALFDPLGSRRREGLRLRAARALLLTRDEILNLTGWNLQRLEAVENLVDEEDKDLLERRNVHQTFSEYKDRQFLLIKELEDLTDIAVKNGDRSSHSAAVAAVKARAEILDKVLKAGQELGVISRTAKEISIKGTIDVSKHSIKQLQILIKKRIEITQDLLGDPMRASLREGNGQTIDALFRRLPGRTQEVPKETRAHRIPRVRKVKKSATG